ncbi:CAF1 family ribonuclease-like protein [Elsinoe australis]|uniref:poly(A)-specific ribonuclease n=1 Tax=Elsinoe australis TaxID=40998 RepID=A0A4U7BFL6_9PEZI|nr:CAF1 family ribonuclease-like protein [Elsinoe australis]
MPPTVGRMPGHQSNPSNPYAHLAPAHSLPHYQQLQSIPQAPGAHSSFGSVSFPSGISPFSPAAGAMGGLQGGAYGGAGIGAGTGLGSEEAFRGFARGAAIQQQQAQHAEAAQFGLKSGMAGRIRDVWANNLEQEMTILRQLIQKYPFVSMDAEFPGIVARPIGNFESKASYHYQTLRCNVDLLKPIQLGITLWSPEGELPPSQPDRTVLPKMPYSNNLMVCPCTWSFNFQFSLDEDMYAEGSIDMLKAAGLDFSRHQTMGIDPNAFGAALMTSGLAFMEDVNWLSFHSGYDFGYLVKLLTNSPLPSDEDEFRELVKIYFPKLWDIKFLLRHAQRSMAAQNRLTPTASTIINTLGTKSGLADLANELSCQRVGTPHTGASDSWLTGQVFWAMRSKIFDGHVPDELSDQIYGLHGIGPPASAQARDEFLNNQGQQTPQTNGASLSFHTGHTPSTHQGPSTPNSSHAGLSGTPGPGQYSQHNLGHGGFGNFSMGNR